MLYCNKCKENNDWPESVVKSYGSCEICGEVGECNDKKIYDLANESKSAIDTVKLGQELMIISLILIVTSVAELIRCYVAFRTEMIFDGVIFLLSTILLFYYARYLWNTSRKL
jgi:hypothetical protein